MARCVRWIAAVTGCGSCWASARIRPGCEYEPGRFVAVVHGGHVPELEARGWAVIPCMYDDGDDVVDVLCRHLVARVA
jgi:hypothetical protein